MVEIKHEISKEDYEQAKKKGSAFLIPQSIFMGYGVYGSCVKEEDGKYFLEYKRGESCD